MSRFSSVPTIRAPRSKFNLSYGVKTSMNVGTLYPVYLQEIYPGDTFNVDTTFVARVSSSFLRPVMDNLFIDFMYFFVPHRLVFEDFPSVLGENKKSAWAAPEETFVPSNSSVDQQGAGSVAPKSVADYLGLPPKFQGVGFSILPFRAFAKIYDDWFRDENLIDPMLIHTGNWVNSENLNNNPWSPSNYTGKLPHVAKFHDTFTSALPNTQKSAEPVGVPLSSNAPIVASDTMHNGGVLRFSSSVSEFGPADLQTTSYTSSVPGGLLAVPSAAAPSGTPFVTQNNMVADLAQAGLVSVTDLRYAFQLQRILERSARAGTRYSEYLLSAFGVLSPDARLQRSEYLGGKRMPISVQQVAQTTRGTTQDEELGSLGAFSLTNGKCGYQKGFVEHGYVIGVACIRQYHTYQQGIEKFWQRLSRFEFYDPILANISEQPIYKSELYGIGAAHNGDIKDEVFGFQEAWYDLCSRQNIVTGDMRSDSSTSLDVWHFADDYSNAPTLNEQFITETPTYVDRTLAVPSTSLDQFIVDIYHNQSAIRCLPPYSIPELID